MNTFSKLILKNFHLSQFLKVAKIRFCTSLIIRQIARKKSWIWKKLKHCKIRIRNLWMRWYMIGKPGCQYRPCPVSDACMTACSWSVDEQATNGTVDVRSSVACTGGTWNTLTNQFCATGRLLQLFAVVALRAISRFICRYRRHSSLQAARANLTRVVSFHRLRVTPATEVGLLLGEPFTHILCTYMCRYGSPCSRPIYSYELGVVIACPHSISANVHFIHSFIVHALRVVTAWRHAFYHRNSRERACASRFCWPAGLYIYIIHKTTAACKHIQRPATSLKAVIVQRCQYYIQCTVHRLQLVN